ncbi:MAG: winged helix-turn-helix transcriptional regulator [Candidatus Thorarchaeota archaeon]|nr:MAG: winged helix-turn-helix transcriptional regulator [Candidatus Thorarchaeota archaeon]
MSSTDMVQNMDHVDRDIINELTANCRVSYETMARKLGITANAVRRRMLNLTESGVISEFVLLPSFAMVDVHFLIGLTWTDGARNDDEIVELIGSHPFITSVGFDSFGTIIFNAEYPEDSGLEEITDFLRDEVNVTDLELHPVSRPRGVKFEPSALQLRVLRCLAEDPRMSVTTVAEKSGLTAKRVRRIIEQLQDSRGFEFTIIRNLNAGSNTNFVIRVEWDDALTGPENIVNWLETEHPKEYWYPNISHSERVMFPVFVVDHLKDIEAIFKHLMELPNIFPHATLIPYPRKRFPGSRERYLQELLSRS